MIRKEEWIPINRQLPKRDCNCFVSCMYKSGRSEVREAMFSLDEESFIGRETGLGLDFIATAWMLRHVPKPYNPKPEQLPGQISIKDIQGVVPEGGK